MALTTQQPTTPPRKGWVARWFGKDTLQPPRPEAAPLPEGEAIAQFIGELVSDDRYVFALLRRAEEHVAGCDLRLAWKALTERMALVPIGRLMVLRSDGVEELIEIPSFYLDRVAVTNRQFERFVASGCYDSLELWPREVWSGLMQFTDRTGRPGPSGWIHGTYPPGKADHPVVGICWYEAVAYARWVGKRLPTAAEWQKAGGWPEHLGDGGCTRYPWGDLFDPKRANLWASGLGDTAPVHAFPGGDTPNGIRQMTGNVWEWLEDPLDAIPLEENESFQPWKPMRRIAGGSFNTYLPNESTNRFVTGQGELDRRDNIGFRCAVSADRLSDPPAPA